jgi:hypothetical protein
MPHCLPAERKILHDTLGRMRQSLTLPVTIVATAMAALTAAEPPNDDSADSFDIEPPLLIPNRSIESSPVAASSPTPAPDVETLEKQFERAKKNEKSAERLCKIGVLSQVEVEQRALTIIRLECALEDARLARATDEFILQQSRFAAAEISKPDLAQAESALTRATENAHASATKLAQAEVAAAETNLHRQQKLLALGSARKSDVSRAEEKLAELKAPKN